MNGRDYSKEELDIWFNSNALNDEGQRLHAAIGEIFPTVVDGLISRLEAGGEVTHDEINAVMRAQADIVNDNAPCSRDRDSAMYNLALARNAINAASLPQAANARVTLMQMAISYLLAATWQARTAIARDARYRIPRVELDN